MALASRLSLLAAGFASVVALGFSNQASAAPLLGIELAQTGYATYTSTGGNPLVVTQSEGTFGLNVEVNTLNTSPLSIDLGSTNITAAGPGTLTIIASVNGLTSPVGLASFLTQLTGHLVYGTGSVSMSSYIDNTNTLFGTKTALSTVTMGNMATASGTTSAPFAITEVFTLTATAANAEFSIDGSTSNVPEPASLALLGSALVGLGMIRRRCSKSA